jgi:protein O-GlcNAc transferase
MLKWIKRKIADKSVAAVPPAAEPAVAQDPPAQNLKKQGDEHVKAGRYADAEHCYRQVKDSDAQYPGALVMLGFVLREQGQLDRAREVLERAVVIAPQDADGHFLLASILEAAGSRGAEIAHLRKAVELRPNFELARGRLIDAQQTLSRILLEAGQLEQGEASYRREIELTPDHFGPHHMLGVVLNRQGRYAEAIELFKRAISLKPDSGASYASLGNAYLDLDDTAEENLALAETYLEKAVAVQPGHSECHCALGLYHWRRIQLDRALVSFDKAIETDPNNAKARWARVMLQASPRSSSQSGVLAKRSAFAAELAEFANWWDKSDSDGAEFVGELQPFFLTYEEEDNLPLLQQHGQMCARAMERWLGRQEAPPFKKPAAGRIRLGIVSADVRLHSNWLALIEGWFRSFDRKRFEIVVFSLSDQADKETSLAGEQSDVFIGGPKSLSQWVAAMREQNCEVLLYPGVGLDPMTLKLASLRLAPVQINSWGHADTSGLPTIDYYLSAACFEPADAQAHYTERLILLPHLGNRVQSLNLTGGDPDFAALNINLERPILVCPGTPFKYQPQHDPVFVEIARRTADAQLVFFMRPGEALSDVLQTRITAAFEAAGLDAANHLRFVRWLNFREFHSLMRHADVMLDTIGFSGYNTAVQAIECGLPIVTREGRFLRGRLASGVLRRMDLQELIVQTKADYVDRVVKLVTDRPYQAHIRHEIEQRRPVLFNDQSAMGPFQDFLESAARAVRDG